MREVDDELVARARIYVDNREAVLAEAGDLLSPLARGIITADAIVGDLPSIASCTVRAQAGGISLFNSVIKRIHAIASRGRLGAVHGFRVDIGRIVAGVGGRRGLGLEARTVAETDHVIIHRHRIVGELAVVTVKTE